MQIFFSNLFQIIFNVLGFSSRGRVLIGLKPVAGAEIFVNHKMKTTSDQNGWFGFLF